MKIKKILSMVAASAIAVSAMAFSASADDLTAKMSFQLNVEINEEVGEWPENATVALKLGEETTIKYTYDEEVKIANFFAIETSIPEVKGDDGEVIENVSIEVKSLKLDGTDVAFDNAKASVHSENNVWRYEFFKDPSWGGTAMSVDAPSLANFKEIEVTFVASMIEDETPDESTTDTDTDTDKDSGNADTSDAGIVALVALSAVAATGLVVAKKRK